MTVESATDNDNGGSPTWKIVAVASIAVGVQFGWALQLSLLTPYVQTLGVPHAWASFIWLCGPISGLLVQPLVGFYSDRCTAAFGRRRPFIGAGSLCVCFAVILIGFAKDIGHAAGDAVERKTKPRAVAVFVVGFWVLDVANNMLQGPCRAFLADLSGGDHRKMRVANGLYSFFMAVGNVLGYAAGSLGDMHKILPFTETAVCDTACANLKTCFIIDIVLLSFVTVFALASVTEKRFTLDEIKTGDGEGEGGVPFFGEMAKSFKNLSKPMWILLLVTCLNWVAWFPFFLYDTDWMGSEVYGGKVDGTKPQQKMYDLGVRAGALGLMLNSFVLALVALAVEPVGRIIGGVKRLWGIVNIILGVCLFTTIYITRQAEEWRSVHGGADPPPSYIKNMALAFFGVLGIPLSVTFSIPFALASIYCSISGGGQGLSLGVVNMSIVVPQMIVSIVSGPLDAALGGGNLPAFGMGGISAIISAFLALFLLPNPSDNSLPAITPGGGGH